MRYDFSEAYSLDDFGDSSQRYATSTSSSFDVIEGAGLDQQARQGVSAQFLQHVRLAIAIACAVLTIGFVRITLSAATVSSLQSNYALEDQVTTAQDLNNDLRVCRSVLSNGSRIERLATQQYGMYLAAPEVLIASTDTNDTDMSAIVNADPSAGTTDCANTQN